MALMVYTRALVLVLCLVNVSDAKDCYDYTDCDTCSKSTETIGWFFQFDCNWCPLDRRCHVSGSLQTPCLGSMNIHTPTECPVEDYKTYDKEKAYRATLLSAAAYYGNPETCLSSIAASDGVDVRNVIVTRCDDFNFDYEACLAFVGVSTSKEEISVVFRGTQHPKQLVDQVLTTLTEATVSSDIGGKVQAYFDNAYTEMYPCVRASVASLVQQYPLYSVLVAGHSLGGAIASLTAASLVQDGTVAKSKMDLYTLGMPRVGDKNYAYYHDKVLMSSWNVVNYRDIVPHTPFCNFITGCNFPRNMPFQHRTEVYYANMNSGKNSAYVVCHENEDQTCSNGAVTDNPCDFDIADCIILHKRYFGIDVGAHCTNKLGSSGNIWGTLTSSTCKTISS